MLESLKYSSEQIIYEVLESSILKNDCQQYVHAGATLGETSKMRLGLTLRAQ